MEFIPYIKINADRKKENEKERKLSQKSPKEITKDYRVSLVEVRSQTQPTKSEELTAELPSGNAMCWSC